jgi:2,3-dihydroxybenzoate decarboxylase
MTARVIAIEEHYYDAEVVSQYDGADSHLGHFVRSKLEDTGAERLAAMDAAGIDMQVLSHGSPSTQRMDPATGVRVARSANERLAELCRSHPDRFAGFAMLPTTDPAAAADELERCVTELGLVGAMIHGLTGPERLFIDDQRFWPIFERAAALGVPLYIHPARPHPTVTKIYLGDYVESHPAVNAAGWGFTMETATAAIRIVLSGVLQEFPEVRLILGHLGETVPFLLWRIDLALNRPGNDGVPFAELFREHFHITTSGFFSDAALQCCIDEMGIDRLLFAIDYPFVPIEPGPKWMAESPLPDVDKRKILSENAERLLGV